MRAAGCDPNADNQHQLCTASYSYDRYLGALSSPSSVEQVVDGRRGDEDNGGHGLRGAGAALALDKGLPGRLLGLPVGAAVAVAVHAVDGALHVGGAGGGGVVVRARRQAEGDANRSPVEAAAKLVPRAAVGRAVVDGLRGDREGCETLV